MLKNNEKKFEKEIERLVNIGIIIGQSVDFYEKLGGERIMEKSNNKKSNEKKKKNKKKKKRKKTLIIFNFFKKYLLILKNL